MTYQATAACGNIVDGKLCGSWYRLGNRGDTPVACNKCRAVCNKCGAVCYDPPEKEREFSREGRPPEGKRWSSKLHRYVFD